MPLESLASVCVQGCDGGTNWVLHGGGGVVDEAIVLVGSYWW